MKKILALLLFSSIVMANCFEYVEIAENRLVPPYPNYFGAAGEYINAADCYHAEGDFSSAKIYYKLGADDYVIAAEQLVQGGDHYQKAKSFELAADAYLKAGFESKALEMYGRSKDIYLSVGYMDEVASVQGKISALTYKEEGGFVGLIGLISLAALFFSILSLVFIMGTNQRLREMIPKKKKINPGSGIVKRRSEHFSSPVVREEPVVRERSVSPRDRAVKKLRDKYLKY